MGAVTRTQPGGGAWLHSATLTTADPRSDSWTQPGATDRTVVATGAFGAGTVRVQGSNDGTNWVNCHDITGTEIGLTGDGTALVAENPVYLRFDILGSTGATVAVSMCSRRPSQ